MAAGDGLGVARVSLGGDGPDVAVVACEREGEAEFLREWEERGEEGVERTKDFGRLVVASGMAGAVGEEVFEERVVVAERDLDEVLGRLGGRDEGSLIAF